MNRVNELAKSLVLLYLSWPIADLGIYTCDAFVDNGLPTEIAVSNS